MHFTLFASLAAFAGVAVAAPTGYTISADDGFPNPSPAQLQVISETADGSLSNAPPPAKLNESSFPVFQLIRHNENFEVAFFDSLLYNITNNVPGFTMKNSKKRDELLDIVRTIKAQEELHSINAGKVLDNFKVFNPPPCKYQFPTTTIVDALALADRFTDVVLGTLQTAALTLARNGDAGTVRGVTSSLGQEGQQSGFYRILLAKKPSEKPFLTTNLAPFAFTALQQFIVSCPFDLKQIPIDTFPPLNVLTGNNGFNVEPRDQHLSFSVDFTGVSAADKYIGGNGDGLFITYFTGQLLPVSVPLVNPRWTGRAVTFEAQFPFVENIMDGLSIASLTTRNNFASPDEVVSSKAVLAAPGFIQADDRVKSWDGMKL
ncbi:hypothetical protein QBC47DRAFT_373463 [Echria macrotheca]|uniref:Late sexual development protein n=1 Tax=Echria macrotheca TaxID=438768 RepID=A0AAJ0F8G9_9PEZI|nr:hypothetical protein QBC47DRAFT_373463 [Echria macrotheca]